MRFKYWIAVIINLAFVLRFSKCALAVLMLFIFSLLPCSSHAAKKIANLKTRTGTTILLYERYTKKDNNPFNPSSLSGNLNKNSSKIHKKAMTTQSNSLQDLFTGKDLFSTKGKGVALQILENQYPAQKSLKQMHYSRLIAIARKSPHFHYITEEIKKRQLPGELAFLPLIESNFQQNAVSHRGAEGLWQFMPETGRQYGLKGSKDRRDVKASTEAALTYLEYLHQKFNQDWMLALAAYNAGEGTVSRAIEGNRRAGKPANFWALKLPKETREYVPKFLEVLRALNLQELKHKK